MDATKIPTAKGFAYTVDGCTRNSKTDYGFALAGTGNQFNASGVWFTMHKTRQLAFKAQTQRGAGEILTF